MGPLSKNVPSANKRKFTPNSEEIVNINLNSTKENLKVDDGDSELDDDLLGEINNDSDSSDEEPSDYDETDEEEEENEKEKNPKTNNKNKSNVLKSLQSNNENDDSSINSEDISDIDTEDEEENDDDYSELEDSDNSDEEEDKEKEIKNTPSTSKTNKIKSNNKNKKLNVNNKTYEKSSDKVKETKNENEENSKDLNKEKKFNGAVQKIVKSTNSLKLKEYENETDTSDEEDIRNTVGNIPMNWYDDYPHLGYDWSGKKIMKPEQGDQLDDFLSKMENPDFWRSVKDPQTGQNVVLSDKDIALIRSIRNNKYPDPEFDEYAPWVDWFSSEVMKMPLNREPDHKKSFIPSKSEAALVNKFVYSLKMGWMKKTSWMKRHRKDLSKKKFYMLWPNDTDAEEMRRIHNHIPAPKRFLPGHAESYNPPGEYLFNEKEIREWEELKGQVWNRKLHFIPQKYNSLREVPAYRNYLKERFTRCLDLYMCPRARVMKVKIEAEDLLPKLPDPKDLQPFPTTLSMEYLGHNNFVRCISIEPQGQHIVSGSDDMTVKVWEIATGRCVRTIDVGGIVRSVAWCPNTALSLIAVASDKKLFIINPKVGDTLISTKTDDLMQDPPENVVLPDKVKAVVGWEIPDAEFWENNIRITLNHFKEIKQVTWHGRGDYFASVMPEGLNRSVLIHQLSTRKSQIPFGKAKGLIQCVLFHPVRPFFFVATQVNIRIYDLVKQEIVKKLFTHSKWISSMSVHPGGDNLLVGTYDKKVLWFDLDLSVNPYKVLKLHGNAVRSVTYHKRYPLFATCSDDLSVIISHGMIYSDLLQNPLVVPLKLLRHHQVKKDYGVFDVIFHPTQPWVFSCGADKRVLLYT